jgi:dihydroorotate dehydrogenase (NAD+) catalytic subunit
VRPDLTVALPGLRLKNPVLVASGTFGYGREFASFYDLSRLGGIMVKGVSPEPWAGNPGVRIYETPAGLLNAIGLQNPGLQHFLQVDLPWLAQFDTAVVVNVVGHNVEDYCTVARAVSVPGVAALELNVSCPNVEGGLDFGTNPEALTRLVAAVKEVTYLPVIVKLSPNVTDVVAVAEAAVQGGADMLSLINTLVGMAIDVDTARPVLGNVTGGLSGPAVKPVALRMVWEVSAAVPVPVIGMGGIVGWRDAVEFLMAGASAVAVGSANFVNPWAAPEIVAGLEDFLARRGVARVADLVGLARRQQPWQS